MNKIVYTSTYYGKTFTFYDKDLVSGSMQDTLNNALVSETLSIDTAKFTIQDRHNLIEPLTDENGEDLYDEDGDLLWAYSLDYANYDFSKYNYGDTVLFYQDNVLKGRYFLSDVHIAGDGSNNITFALESIMGLLANMEHEGGIYTGTTAGTLIAELMSGFTYTIDGTLSSTQLYGWLPYDTRLGNLTQVLFACGASILKDANGNLNFTFNLPTTASTFDIDSSYLGGVQDDVSPATLVRLTEHTYYASASVTSDVLFDNTNGIVAQNYKITFEKPYHTLVANGLTINSSGANWAIVSGTGTLTGKPYVHVQRILNKSTGIIGATNEKNASGCTLISQLNSEQTLDRLVDYYSQTREYSVGITAGDEKPGSMIEIPDPVDKTKTVTGYIKSMQRTFSSNLKANVKLTSGWSPSHVGNAYDRSLIVRASDLVNGVWPVLTALQAKKVLINLFGGAQGGQGGWYGTDPGELRGSGSVYGNFMDSTNTSHYLYKKGDIQAGGDGGAGGQGGFPGKMLAFNLASLNASYGVSLGAGGAGGNGGTETRNTELEAVYTDPTDGSYGTHSVFDSTYDTDNGVLPQAAIVDMISGQIVADQHGDTGVAGAKGGDGGPSAYWADNSTTTYDYSATGKGKNGGSVGANTGGTGANGTVGGYKKKYNSSNYRHFPLGGGGGGGGAADGSNGSAGTTQQYYPYKDDSDGDRYWMTGRRYEWWEVVDGQTVYHDTYYSSNGGDGANASNTPAQADLTGGKGGSGGGGGGGCGQLLGSNIFLSSGSSSENRGGLGIGGKGGNGGQGGQGSDGWMIVYYKEDVLPSGYTRLAYIRSAGSSYIVTDITPGDDVTICVEAEGEPSSSSQIFVSRSNNGRQWLGTASDGEWNIGPALSGYTKIDAILNYTAAGITGYMNGDTCTLNQTTSNTSKVAFMANNAGSYKATGKLYRANIYMGGQWVFLGIPAKNSSNEAGLYDMVSGNFYTSVTATPFEAGDEI